jgi:dipeptidyl aminopeptidase/acylaminoacyl peptidase
MTTHRIALTDELIERMLAERSGSRIPAGLVGAIVSKSAVTPQPRSIRLPGLSWNLRPGFVWLLVALALALVVIGGAIAGASRRTAVSPDGGGPMIAAQFYPAGRSPTSIRVFELDPATGERLPLVELPGVDPSSFGVSMRAVWARDHGHALLFDDFGRPRGIVDVAHHSLIALSPADVANGDDQVTWSPAGDRFAWLNGPAGRSTLVISDVTGRELRRLALPTDLSDLTQPSWSPDGSAILVVTAYGCVVCPRGPRAIAVPVDGSPSRTLLDETSGNVTRAVWSPDGSSLAYSTSGGISTMTLADGRRTVVTSGADIQLAWSPDGRRIAFTRLNADAERTGIFVVDSDGSNLTQLTDGADDTPIWSPDGSWLAFNRDQGIIEPSAWVIPRTGGEPRLVVESARADW